MTSKKVKIIKHEVKSARGHGNNLEILSIGSSTIWKMVSAVLVLLLLGSVSTGGFGLKFVLVDSDTMDQLEQEVKNEPTNNVPTQAPSAPSSEDIAALMDDDAVKGDPNAPVTIIEWSDFECPYCTRFYTNTLTLIDEQYIQTGKVKFVYRDFPLGFHSNAQKAAEAAECAGEQDKFWEMHDALFDNGVSGGVTAFKQYAVDLGLDTTVFNSCLDSGDMAAEVAKDLRDGQAVGVSGTPGFLINGQLVVGAQPFAVFQQIIESELAK